MRVQHYHEIAGAVISTVKKGGWDARVYHKKDNFIFLSLSADCPFSTIHVEIELFDDAYVVYSRINMLAEEENRKEVLKYLTHANYCSHLGSFGIDMDSGEIQYKCAVDCSDAVPSEEVIAGSIVVGVKMFTHLGEELLNVMLGVESAEEAMEAFSD